MVKTTKFIIASPQHDLVMCARAAAQAANIDSIITVSSSQNVQNKLDSAVSNIVLWDIAAERQDISWASNMRNRYDLNIVYTSFDRTPPAILMRHPQDYFISRPAIFTSTTTARYTDSLKVLLTGVQCNRTTISSRDIARAVPVYGRQKIVVIASSTGGTTALEEIIKRLPQDSPPIVIVQHMPGGFTKLFADRLDALYPQEVIEAETGDLLMRGRILLAPADRHIKLVKHQSHIAVDCFVGQRIHGVMPAADVLFDSVAELVGGNAVGVVLTGMGNDGAAGLKRMHVAGCTNIGQDEDSSVVYGMAKAAKGMGAIHYELPLTDIAAKIMQLV